MKIVSKLKILAGFICITTGAITQGYATATCNGASLSACEAISADCVWANNTCTAPTNGGCYGKSNTACGKTDQGSNSRWCYLHGTPKSCQTRAHL